jgi:hypothetical protein
MIGIVQKSRLRIAVLIFILLIGMSIGALVLLSRKSTSKVATPFSTETKELFVPEAVPAEAVIKYE